MSKKALSIILAVLMILSACTVSISASIKDIATNDKHVSESKSSVDHAALANTLTDSLSEKQHPYILYTDEDIPVFKEKIKSGLSKKAYERVIMTADSYLNKGISVKTGANGIVGRQLQAYVTYLATASALTGDAKYAQKAIELVTTAASQGNADIYLSINGALCISDFGHAYALAYDCLYEYMDESQRAAIEAEMIEIGTWIYEESVPTDTWGSQLDRRKAWNWNAVTHGALGLIALSLGDKADWLALSLRRATDYYDFAVDDTGAAMEGLHYLGYGLNSLVPFDAAIYRLTGIELMDDYPELQLMPAWSTLYMTLPQGNAQASIGQGSKMDNHAAPFYIINRYSLSEELWGFYNTYDLWDDKPFVADYEGNGWNCPAIIFYEDQSLTPIKPTEEEYPLIKEFDKGLVIARDSWDSDASMVTFTCGVGFSGCWNHPDDNTFTFSAKGDKYIIDLGAGKLTSEEHNVVLVDGVGMSYEGGAITRPGDLQEVTILENGNLYVRGDNVASYWKNEIKISARHLVYGDGETPFVLIYDNMRKDAAEHDFSINFYTDPNATVEVSDNARYATITGANSGEVCYVIPMADEFVFVEAEKANGNNRITTQTTISAFAQATLFIMAEPDGSMPEVDYELIGKNFSVTITRTHNGEKVTETYVFGTDRFISFDTDEVLDVTPPTVDTESSETVTETETETNTEATTDSSEVTDTSAETEASEETETETKAETTEKAETVETTEAQTAESTISTESSQTTESETAKSEDSAGGCGSSIALSVAPIVAALTTSAIIIRKKKDQDQ